MSALLVDHAGVVWSGVVGGNLSRFDGSQFTNFMREGDIPMRALRICSAWNSRTAGKRIIDPADRVASQSAARAIGNRPVVRAGVRDEVLGDIRLLIAGSDGAGIPAAGVCAGRSSSLLR